MKLLTDIQLGGLCVGAKGLIESGRISDVRAAKRIAVNLTNITGQNISWASLQLVAYNIAGQGVEKRPPTLRAMEFHSNNPDVNLQQLKDMVVYYKDMNLH